MGKKNKRARRSQRSLARGHLKKVINPLNLRATQKTGRRREFAASPGEKGIKHEDLFVPDQPGKVAIFRGMKYLKITRVTLNLNPLSIRNL